MARSFHVEMIKPSHYDDEGYIIQWWKASIPSNSLASVYAIVQDAAERRVLGDDVELTQRPVVIVQDGSFDATDSITICAFTRDETEASLFRLPVEPNERNGLRTTCRLMVDEITTVPKTKVGARRQAG